MAKKPTKIIVRSGFKSQVKGLDQAEIGFVTDTRELIVGDGSAKSPRIPTTKSTEDFDLSSVQKFTFDNIELKGDLNGVDIHDIIEKIDSAYSSETRVYLTQLPKGIHLTINSNSLSEAPQNPAAGDVYLVPSGATGVWQGHDGSLAQKRGTDWYYVNAPVTTIIGVADTGATLVRRNSGWVNFFPSDTDQLDRTINDRPATPSGVYNIIQNYLGTGGEDGTGGESISFRPKYTAAAGPPENPSLTDQWFNTSNGVLYTWGTDGDSFLWISIGDPNGNSTTASAVNSDYTLPITWRYGTDKFSFETWTNDTRFKWRDFDSVKVNGADAGDDSIDLASTVGLSVGNTYVLVDANNQFIQTVDVISILNATRIRVRNDLAISIASGDNVSLARTSFDVRDRYAFVKNGDRLFTRYIRNIPADAKANLVIRRSATGTGIFKIRYRVLGDAFFTDLDLTKTVPEGTEFREEYYDIPRGGNMQFDIGFTATMGQSDTISHMATFPKSQAVDANRVYKPVNQTPADQSVNISTTPTLTGSAYRSLFALPQNGAEFQVAVDNKFTNLVISSSTDFLASWARVTGQTTNFKSLVFIDNKTAILVGDGGAVRTTTDAGNTFTTYALTANTIDAKAIAYSGSRLIAVGSTGGINYSDNLGQTWTAGTPANSFAGTFNGVTANGQIAIAVGTSAEIERSVNAGVIWTKITADNAYTGTFNAVAADPTGNFMIAVGSNGEIQTSSNKGQNWVHRSNNNNYTGTFYGVAMDGSGNAIVVGSNGEIQVSADYGATWTKVANGLNSGTPYTGTLYDVDLLNGNAIAVGSGGEIQSSKDNGRTWQHRTAANTETGIFRAAAQTPDNYALIVGDGGIVQKSVKITASTSYTVPAGSDFLGLNKVYYWRVRYQDQGGFWSDYSDPTVFATQTTLNAVKQAQNLSPANEATAISITPTLQSSAFSTVAGTDTHAFSQWQISTDSTFSTTAVDSGDSSSLLVYTVPNANALLNATRYFWRVRHKGTSFGYGPWSAPTAFTALAKPNTPVITTPGDRKIVDADYVTVMSGPYVSNIPGDTLQTTQFQFALTADFINPIVTNFAGQGGTIGSKFLAYKTVYYIRSRQKGTLSADYSAWSPVVQIQTTSAIAIGEYSSLSRGKVFGTNNTYSATWTVPRDVFLISVVCVGGGAAPFITTGPNVSYIGGGGGGLTYKNNIPVTPGQQFNIIVGKAGSVSSPAGGTTSFSSKSGIVPAIAISATGGTVSGQGGTGGQGGIGLGGDGGGNGGNTFPIAQNSDYRHSGGGGAGGYSGNGGDGAYMLSTTSPATLATAGAGGGGGGGSISDPAGAKTAATFKCYSGGGVGLQGQGGNGVAGVFGSTRPQGGNGSGGTDTTSGTFGLSGQASSEVNGGTCGGGGAARGGFFFGNTTLSDIDGGAGGIRIIWGRGRTFPFNAV